MVKDTAQSAQTAIPVPDEFKGPVRSVAHIALVASNIRFHESRLKSIDAEPDVIAAKRIIEDANKRKTEIMLTFAEYKNRMKKSTIGILTRMFDKDPKRKDGRTYKGEGFKVGLKKTPGAINPIDRDLALEWAKIHAPNAVVIKETFDANKLTEDQRNEIFTMTKSNAENIGFSPVPSEEGVHWSV